jgi:hypothetical protein
LILAIATNCRRVICYLPIKKNVNPVPLENIKQKHLHISHRFDN